MKREPEYATGAPRRAAVLEVRRPGTGAFVLRFSRDNLEFAPGQYVSVGVPESIDMREYSVYSTPEDEHLEILVKEVQDGAISPALGARRPGDQVTFRGPFGEFLIDPAARATGRFLFVATGSGIAPFRSFVRAYPGLDYRLLHGVRSRAERYEYETYEAGRYTACISREPIDAGASSVGGPPSSAVRPPTSVGGAPSNARSGSPVEEQLFQGRVTDYLRANPADAEALCYLCGSCDMIYEVMAILRRQGVPREQVFAEVYY